MAPYLIPDDWDGEDYQCIKLYWPNSDQWRSILAGVLTSLGRGRTWDRKSGVITTAQVWGWGIFTRTYPFAQCEVCDDDDDETTQGRYPDSFLDGWQSESPVCDQDCNQGDCEMSCNSPSPPIRISAGKLYYWHCCQWVLVGSLEGQVEDVPPDWSGDPETETYYKCGKASAIVDTIFGVCRSCWDERDNYPWQWSGHVKGDWPGLQLSTNYIAITVTQAILVTTLAWDEGDWDTDAKKQEARIRIAPLMTADAEPLSDSVYNQIRGILAGLFDLTQAPLGLLLANALDVIGKGDLSNVGALGATTDTDNCDTPTALLTPPEDTDWCYDFDFEEGEQGFTSDEGSYLAGTGFRGTTNYFSNGSRIQFSRDNDVGDNTTVRYVGIVYDVPTGSSGEGEDDLIRGFGTAISDTNIELSEGEDQVYVKQGTQSIPSTSNDVGVDFSFTYTDSQPIIVKRLVICGDGDDPLDGS